MKKKSAPIDLLNVQNWPKLAAAVHFQAADLAKLWKVHPRKLQRAFRRQLHTTPQKHFDSIRVNKAQELARDGMRTKEISNVLEYKQVSHLCRQVHNFLGARLKVWRPAA
jgi:transcriptional regulator GlxA family with amidase domain